MDPLRHLVVDDCLRKLGRDTHSLRSVLPLPGSASGAHVQLIRLGDQEVVLKTTTRREVAFYRMAVRLPVRVPRVVAAAGTCLLLEALVPGPAAVDWPAAHWHEVASQLGALHRPQVAAAFHGWLTRKRRPGGRMQLLKRAGPRRSSRCWTGSATSVWTCRPA